MMHTQPNAMNRRHFLRQAAFAGATVLGTPVLGQSLKPRSKRPNLVFVLADQWRKQAIGYRGEDVVQTPHVDRFVQEAVVFDNACACRPVCSPNRACLFTGLYPQRHGLYMNNAAQLAPEVQSLGQVLKASGYKTAYIGKWHMGGELEGHGIPPGPRRHGWDHWIMSHQHQPLNQPYFIQDATTSRRITGWAPDFETDQAIEFIESHRDRPFALVLSWGPPHTGGGKGFEDRWQPGKRTNGEIKYGYGYAAPEEFEKPYRPFEPLPRRANVRPVDVKGKPTDPSGHTLPGYWGACTSLDACFGRLIHKLKREGLFEDTVVVFTADHGEMLGSHGKMTKGVYYEESIGVPLMISYPRQVVVKRVNDLANSIDVMPTVLNLMGIKIPKQADGKDLSDFIRGQAKHTQDEIFLSFDASGPQAQATDPSGSRRAWRAIRTDRYLYALLDSNYAGKNPHQDRHVLYDLNQDPYQMSPLFWSTKYDKVIKDLHNRLIQHLNEIGDDFMQTKHVW